MRSDLQRERCRWLFKSPLAGGGGILWRPHCRSHSLLPLLICQWQVSDSWIISYCVPWMLSPTLASTTTVDLLTCCILICTGWTSPGESCTSCVWLNTDVCSRRRHSTRTTTALSLSLKWSVSRQHLRSATRQRLLITSLPSQRVRPLCLRCDRSDGLELFVWWTAND